MGQEPNIEVDESDRPRPGPEPAAARRWQPGRPGEILSPAEAVTGGWFGRPGPDTGWVHKLVKNAQFERGDQPEDLEAIVATVAAARAAHFGRAPTPVDVEVALILLGLRPGGIPDQVVDELSSVRKAWLKKSAHERSKGQGFTATLSESLLASSPDRLRHVLNAPSRFG